MGGRDEEKIRKKKHREQLRRERQGTWTNSTCSDRTREKSKGGTGEGVGGARERQGNGREGREKERDSCEGRKANIEYK